ncbi:hypothetical protein A2858_02495 [Candidatus Daviesbacteria bacterium RIFCSPHIGHO2_01_FULL_36_37]|uniref:DUF5659 domain-containing protein n=3 Tax=Candidatus Daviesiibacteriota TaxID=1752718 RepID=A0A1F5K1V4_9BACT|nr:MAG: hypothetical protein US28_C0017G0007 [Candidatus Daviesbacteria bacterium GW2011_GWA1_36_8]OGE16683.1 MAG: hypothetical protein A2858_02495 [Candidatus Daviesbacteria bacterium RIFCSPHIGHO2_01_FULL_36_37]OGE34760.1 MAG: hypothetical protein A3E66_04015 [Candidatus Daviesbacteria bacterium RIFCSPHIGHO2_12_FULL_37_16]
MEKPKEYKCNDFYQAVILKTAGVPLIRLEKTTERFFNFVFDDPEENVKNIISQYWNNKLKVDARDLIESINELKTRIHSGV